MPKSTEPGRQPVESRTPERLADAAALHAGMMEAIGDDLAALSALLATKTDATMFGATEFPVRDLVHAIGAKALRAALDAKKKRATTAVPEPAPPAANRPSSNAGKAAGPRRSWARCASSGRTTLASFAAPGLRRGTRRCGWMTAGCHRGRRG